MNNTQTEKTSKSMKGEARLLADFFKDSGIDVYADPVKFEVAKTLDALYAPQELDNIFVPEEKDIYNLLGNGIILSKYVRITINDLRGVGVLNWNEDTVYYRDGNGGVHKQALLGEDTKGDTYHYDLAKLLDTVNASSVYRKISARDGNNPMVVFSNKVYHLSPKVLGVCSDFAGCMIVSLNIGELKPAIAYCSCEED